MNANRLEDSGMEKNALGKLNTNEPEDAGVEPKNPKIQASKKIFSVPAPAKTQPE